MLLDKRKAGTLVSLFNPRRERWVDHFVWDAARLRIIGRTPLGRATVVMLNMNNDRHEGMVVRIRHRMGICHEADLPFFFPGTAAALGTAYVLDGRAADAVLLLTQAME